MLSSSSVGLGYQDEKEPERYDMHCPQMGGPPTRMNQLKKRCLDRQKDPECRETCFPTCYLERKKKAKGEKDVAGKTKMATYLKNKNSLMEKRKRAALALWEEGKGLRPSQIAEELGVSTPTVRAYIRELKEELGIKNEGWTSKNRPRVFGLLKKDPELTNKQIAARLGVDDSLVSTYRREYNQKNKGKK